MKNIHIISTDKPSRLFKDDFGKLIYSINIDQEQNHFEPQHLFITNNEEIKEGDWFIQVNLNKIIKHHSKNGFLLQPQSFDKKIILTTDPELIKCGIQAIDDEFLEWFVQNPSCEEVETKLVEFEVDMGLGDSCIEYGSYYKIIIPSKEPKQECKGSFKDCFNPLDKCVCDTMKQETLEEVAEEFYSEQSKAYEDEVEPMFDTSRYLVAGFIEGAKWQQQNSYSEEDMQEYAKFCIRCYDKGLPCIIPKDWFEQFKNK